MHKEEVVKNTFQSKICTCTIFNFLMKICKKAKVTMKVVQSWFWIQINPINLTLEFSPEKSGFVYLFEKMKMNPKEREFTRNLN